MKIVVFMLVGALLGAFLGYVGKCTSGACPLTANPFRGAGFGALLGLLFASTSPGNPFARKQPLVESDAIIKVESAAQLEELIKTSPFPVLVDFYADWCGPCRRLAPELSALADLFKGNALIVKVNVDQHRDIAGAYQVKSIPDIRILSGGRELQRLVGYRSRDQLGELLIKAGSAVPGL